MPCNIVLRIRQSFLHASLGFIIRAITCLSTHALCFQVEKKIADELREHGLLAVPDQPLPRGPDYADLDKLTYLTCVIKEAMRVHTVRYHSQKSKLHVVTDSCGACKHPLDSSHHCRSAID